MLWTGFCRGLLLGLVGGLIAGLIEAISIVADAPTGRAAVMEAALYALVVDALACAALGAIAGAVLVLVLRATRAPAHTHVVAALHVSVATATVILFAGLLWAFRANGADRSVGVPIGTTLAILFLAIGLGSFIYPISIPIAGCLLGSARRVAVVGLASSFALAAVLPAQVALEAGQHAVLADKGGEATQVVDPGLLQADLRDDLEIGLEGALARGARASDNPPNVLLITVDALRADHIGACNNDWIETPAVDLLARYSTLSCQTYTQQPQTNPALASLFTSTYPSRHGVRVHMVDRLSESFDTLAKVLQRNGFNTAGIIPWTSLEPAFSGFQQGFQTYEAFILNEPETLQNPTTAALAGLYRRVTQQVALGSAVESVLGLRQGTEASIDGRADVTAAAAINWLANNNKNRFFLWVHYFDPHYPWTPPEPWDQLYDQGYDGRYDGGMGFIYEMRAGVFDPNPRDVEYLRALYASEVSYTDHYIGQVLGYMARLGLLDNTIVVLTADHGEALGERGTSWPSGEYWLHGDDLHDDGIQVPLLIYDPRVPHRGQKLDVPVQHVDIMPTILDMVNVPIPRQAQGRSLVPILDGRDDGADRVAVTTLGDDSQTMIATADGWKLITNPSGSQRELYYLPADPGERTNLAPANPSRALAMLSQLSAWAQANNVRLVSIPESVPRG